MVQQVVATTDHLAFIQQPTGVGTGSTMTPAVVVAVEDSGNNVVTSDQSSVILAINSGNATLGGTLPVLTVNGLATFSDLTVTPRGHTHSRP